MSSEQVDRAAISRRRSPWRVGRKLGRTVYEQVFLGQADEGDRLLGMMDDPRDAALIVALHNQHPDVLAGAVEPAPVPDLAPMYVAGGRTSAVWSPRSGAAWAVTAVRATEEAGGSKVSVFLGDDVLDPAAAEEMGRGLVAAHHWLAS